MLRSRRNKIILAVGVLVVVLGVYLYWRYSPRPGTDSFKPGYDLVLQDYDGNDVRLSEFKRQILIVHSWATWCTYCTDEIKNLATLKNKYGEKIVIIAPNRAEAVQVAKPFSDALSLGDRVVFLLDPNDAFYKSVDGYAMPETLFINDRGEILFHQRGPMNITEVEARVGVLLQ